MTVMRDELHRLLDQVPAEELDEISTYLRSRVPDDADTSPHRTFRSLGAFTGEPDLAANSKDILRDELGRSKREL